MSVDKSEFKHYSSGIAAEDFILKDGNGHTLKVLPENFNTTKNTVLGGKDTSIKGAISTAGKKLFGGGGNVTTGLTAHWRNTGDPNRMSPPFIKKGETVEIYTMGDTGRFWWTETNTETKLRKQEAIVKVYSNESKHGEELTPKNSWKSTMDTINKMIELETTDNDGEAASFRLFANLKKGIVNFKTNKGHDINMDMVSGEITINFDTININCKNFTLNGSDVKVASGTTTLSGGSVNVSSTSDFAAGVKMNGNAITEPMSGEPHSHKVL